MRHNFNSSPILSDRAWFSSLSLVLLVVASAFGILAGMSPEIMIIVGTLALFIWELSRKIVYKRRDGNHPSLIFPNKAYIRLLVTSAGIGLLLVEVGLQLQFVLPFGFIVLAVALILFSLLRFYRLINQ